jgi:hypothetical protein
MEMKNKSGWKLFQAQVFERDMFYAQKKKQKMAG